MQAPKPTTLILVGIILFISWISLRNGLKEGYYPWWRQRLPWYRRRWGRNWWYDPYYTTPANWKYNYYPYFSYY